MPLGVEWTGACPEGAVMDNVRYYRRASFNVQLALFRKYNYTYRYLGNHTAEFHQRSLTASLQKV